MNAHQPRQNGVNHTPQDLQNLEPALINLYREITGGNESQARSIFMYVVRDNAALNPQLND